MRHGPPPQNNCCKAIQIQKKYFPLFCFVFFPFAILICEFGSIFFFSNKVYYQVFLLKWWFRFEKIQQKHAINWFWKFGVHLKYKFGLHVQMQMMCVNILRCNHDASAFLYVN